MNRTLTITMRLKSKTIIGSAEGYGAIIDTDVIFDELGIPYIPARRVKGCLRESAIEVLDMFSMSGINNFIELTKEDKEKYKYEIVNKIFGKPGMIDSSPVSFGNLYLDDYEVLNNWLFYLKTELQGLISKESITSYYTDIAQQTAIEGGIAKRHSLRTCRFLKEGLYFKGIINISVSDNADEYIKLLYLSAKNTRYIGSSRTRGFGKVEFNIEGIDGSNILNRLEVLCT